VSLAVHTVAMVTYCVTEIARTSSPMIEQLDTMTVESSGKEWSKRPIKIKVRETVLSHLK